MRAALSADAAAPPPRAVRLAGDFGHHASRHSASTTTSAPSQSSRPSWGAGRTWGPSGGADVGAAAGAGVPRRPTRSSMFSSSLLELLLALPMRSLPGCSAPCSSGSGSVPPDGSRISTLKKRRAPRRHPCRRRETCHKGCIICLLQMEIAYLIFSSKKFKFM